MPQELLSSVMSHLKRESPESFWLVSVLTSHITGELNFKKCSFSDACMASLLSYSTGSVSKIDLCESSAGDLFLRSLASSTVSKTLEELRWETMKTSDSTAELWGSFTRLKSVRVSFISDLHRPLLFLSKLPMLEKLHLRFSTSNTDPFYYLLNDVISSDFTAFPALLDLEISGFGFFTGSTASEILIDVLRKYPRSREIQRISLCYTHVSTEERLLELAEVCPNAYLGGYSALTHNILSSQPAVCKRLTTVQWSEGGSAELFDFLASMPCLKTLILRDAITVEESYSLPMRLECIEFSPSIVWKSRVVLPTVLWVVIADSRRQYFELAEINYCLSLCTMVFPESRQVFWQRSSTVDAATIQLQQQLKRSRSILGMVVNTAGASVQPEQFRADPFWHPAMRTLTSADHDGLGLTPGFLPSCRELRLEGSFVSVVKTLQPRSVPRLRSLTPTPSPSIDDFTQEQLQRYQEIANRIVSLSQGGYKSGLEIETFFSLHRRLRTLTIAGSIGSGMVFQALRLLSALRAGIVIDDSLNTSWFASRSLTDVAISLQGKGNGFEEKPGPALFNLTPETFPNLQRFSCNCASGRITFRVARLQHLVGLALNRAELDLSVTDCPALVRLSLNQCTIRNIVLKNISSFVEVGEDFPPAALKELRAAKEAKAL